MTSSNSFFHSPYKAFLSLLATFGLMLGALLATSAASAQTVTVGNCTDNSCTTPITTPPPKSLGITVGGWSQMAGIAVGEVLGGDGKGITKTLTDGAIKIGVETFLTGNANPKCEVNCSDSQSKLSIIGEMLSGGSASNQGTGPGKVTSMMGVNNMMAGSVYQTWTAKPLPEPVPAVKP